MRSIKSSIVVLIILCLVAAACGKKAPATLPPPPPPTESPVTEAPPAPPQLVEDRLPVATETRLGEDSITNKTLDDLNRNSPFQPVFFPLDSSDLEEVGRRAATANAELMKANPTWVVTIEGHCDERGTAEYNLALGERRAIAVKAYLTSLGIREDRLRTVSYGKEFPFDSGHNEEAWTANRRAHFVVASR